MGLEAKLKNILGPTAFPPVHSMSNAGLVLIGRTTFSGHGLVRLLIRAVIVILPMPTTCVAK